MRAQNVCTCLLVPWLWGWATFTLLPTSTHHRHQIWLDISVLSHPLLCSWPLSNTSTAWRFAKAVHLHLSYEELIPWEAVKHLSRVLWPLQPVQSNPPMTMTESDEPTPSSLCHKDFQSCSQTQDLHDEIPSSYGAQGRILWRLCSCLLYLSIGEVFKWLMHAFKLVGWKSIGINTQYLSPKWFCGSILIGDREGLKANINSCLALLFMV